MSWSRRRRAVILSGVLAGLTSAWAGAVAASPVQSETTSTVGSTVPGPSTTPEDASPPATIPIVTPPTISAAELEVLSSQLGDLRSEALELSTRRSEVAGEVDVLAANAEQVRAALTRLETSVAAAERRDVDARERVDDTRTALVNAGQALLAAERRVDDETERRNAMVVRAYLEQDDGSGTRDLVRTPDEASRFRYQQRLIETHVGTLGTIVEELDLRRSAAEEAREGRADAVGRAETARDEAAEALEEVEGLRQEQAIALADVAARLDSRLAEAALLEDQGQALGQRIAESEQVLVDMLATTRGFTPVDVDTARLASIARAESALAFSSGQIVRVGQIRVHEVIADNLAQMLADAQADGFVFSGWGYRSAESQIGLRRSHCGPTDYDIYVKPSSQCSPPTATPGNSMHERGLAIDITVNGRIIARRSQPEFQWLARNAARYGFYNLPSEPWHWSVNGN